ncbi:MAG: peptidoglycan DD-metalloendopeptidase family protein [Candidatus Aminicenantes bacterium]|nr:peptidoglycan DD-metalloendopeptidase family protein [Candidatus Aminicenantes bacterium]
MLEKKRRIRFHGGFIFHSKGPIPASSALCGAALFFLTLSLSPVPAQEEITSYQKRLEKINKEIEDLKARIKQEEQRENSILARLSEIGLKKRLTKKEISVLDMQHQQTEKERKTIQAQIAQIKPKLAENKKSAEITLVSLYKYGKLDFFHFLLQAQDLGTMITESKRLNLLARHQDKVLSEYIQNLNNLHEAENKLAQKTEELAELIRKDRQKKQELDEQQRRNNDLIKSIQKDKSFHIKALEEREERKRQLQNLIQKIINEGEGQFVPVIPMYEKKGNLSWPLNGKVISHYGEERHPVYKTKTRNNGIEILPQEDNTIKAVHPGKVVFSSYQRGYGNVIIIDHGLSYYSLYGHCSDMFVKKGDYVQAGDPIAIVGDFTSVKGATLYFEIRKKIKAENPLQWLKRR